MLRGLLCAHNLDNWPLLPGAYPAWIIADVINTITVLNHWTRCYAPIWLSLASRWLKMSLKFKIEKTKRIVSWRWSFDEYYIDNYRSNFTKMKRSNRFLPFEEKHKGETLSTDLFLFLLSRIYGRLYITMNVFVEECNRKTRGLL